MNSTCKYSLQKIHIIHKYIHNKYSTNSAAAQLKPCSEHELPNNNIININKSCGVCEMLIFIKPRWHCPRL